jgi:hypothetical protein
MDETPAQRFIRAYLELVVRKVDVTWETPDPAPEILSASGEAER